MIVRKILSRVNNPVQVSLHELGYDVDIIVAGSCLGFQYVDQADNVFVLKEF
jgi:hypothetical protein